MIGEIIDFPILNCSRLQSELFNFKQQDKENNMKEIPIELIRSREDFAIKNAVPTAEGAVLMAMQYLDVCLLDLNTFVLGYGRIGKVLAKILQGFSTDTTVVCSDEIELAQAGVFGYKRVSLREFGTGIKDAKLIFNTIPAPVLGGDVLKFLGRDVLIIDVASVPGGTDFEACEELGIKTIHALGIPKKYAPVTAENLIREAERKLSV
jgi:dipicolinate synthase subunit A